MERVEPPDSTAAPPSGRYLGLEIGTKRVGVALSDEGGLLASPVLTLYRKRPREDVRSLARLARRHGCVGIVVGEPLHLSGELGAWAAKVRALGEELAVFSGLPVTFWDERLSTQAAHEVLYAAGRPRQEHREIVDQVAAVLILQGFLDARRSVAARTELPAEQV